MKPSEIGFFIDTEIRRQFKNRHKFAIATNRSYVYLNKMLSGMIDNEKSIGLDTLISLLNDLGYEIKVNKKN